MKSNNQTKKILEKKLYKNKKYEKLGIMKSGMKQEQENIGKIY